MIGPGARDLLALRFVSGVPTPTSTDAEESYEGHVLRVRDRPLATRTLDGDGITTCVYVLCGWNRQSDKVAAALRRACRSLRVPLKEEADVADTGPDGQDTRLGGR